MPFFGGEDVYVPLGLDIPVPYVERGHAAERRLLFVGNLFISKGVETCIRAVAALKAKGILLVLDLVGAHVQGDREVILSLVQELELEDEVVFHGVLTGAAKWERFEQADCFVFPSYYPAEKFPNVLIEALGCGLPIVSSQWRGIPELVGEQCAAASLVDPHDQQAFERAVESIVLSENADYIQLRNSARKRYTERYTMETFTASMLAAFERGL